jgi:hypothetical protein
MLTTMRQRKYSCSCQKYSVTTIAKPQNNQLLNRMNYMFTTIHRPLHSWHSVLYGSRALSTTSSTSTKRRRHRFFTHDDDPKKLLSLKDFQQQAQVRNLYRQYLRLIPKASPELLQQVRNEFRSVDHQDLARALSEGRRRYKDLSAMLSTSVGSKDSLDSNDAPIWPWQQASAKSHHHNENPPSPPKPFPPKASLEEKKE